MSEPGSPSEDGPRWRLGLTLLSLDLTQPFLAEMGLKITSPGRLLSIARDFVTRYRTLENDPELEDEERLFTRHRLVTDTIDAIVAVMGPDDGARVVDWVATTLPFEAPSAAGSVVRRRILGRLGRTDTTPHGAALTPGGRETLTRLVTDYGLTTTDLRRRLARQRASRLSTWDQEITASYTPDADPMDWVEDIAENVAADSVWRRLKTSLSALDRAWLVALARQEAEKLDISPDLLEPG